MNGPVKCPACLGIDPGTSCHHIPPVWFECEVCGTYTTDRDLALQACQDQTGTEHWELTKVQRAVLSHRIRTRHDIEVNQSTTNKTWFRVRKRTLHDLRAKARQPTPAEQAENAIRFLGDHFRNAGETTLRVLPHEFRAAIGATDYAGGVWVVKELQDLSMVKCERKVESVQVGASSYKRRKTVRWITLTLGGWERYQRGKRGGFRGRYGFVALKFDDIELDQVMAVVKSTVREQLGYDLVDMRDVEQAGIIDNIMRLQIDNAAFVLADLTHDNLGAYWEAGYAEGLRKPVVYLCKKDVFETRGTHFDANHCTTVPWTVDDPAGFCERLIATLRRSLDNM